MKALSTYRVNQPTTSGGRLVERGKEEMNALIALMIFGMMFVTALVIFGR